MNILFALLVSLPLGDDTPVTMYAVLGLAALVLLIAAVLMGKKPKKK